MAENDIPDIVEQWKTRRGEVPSTSLRAGPSPKSRQGDETSPLRMAAEPTASYRHDRKGKCFLVPADEIRANKYDLSISRYKEIEHKEIKYEKPHVIMEKVLALEGEIAKDVEEIKRMIA
ncbi:MAG: SAM-dependent DNA methyltransferase [Bacteroidetes bacterium]|nr:SAM-dependent DNA methyltransferase [Bacteroidota bacterium]MCW5897071.1 SAM-dependent DNA methyltransferase [Bacteroidota bacterium]